MVSIVEGGVGASGAVGISGLMGNEGLSVIPGKLGVSMIMPGESDVDPEPSGNV